MSDHIIVPGDKLHIITRRLFPEDLRRHFAGEVIRAAGELCEVKGYAFVFYSGSNEYQRRPQVWVRIFSIGDALNIVNKLPGDVDLHALEYRVVNGRLVVTDSKGFSLDINEFSANA